MSCCENCCGTTVVREERIQRSSHHRCAIITLLVVGILMAILGLGLSPMLFSRVNYPLPLGLLIGGIVGIVLFTVGLNLNQQAAKKNSEKKNVPSAPLSFSMPSAPVTRVPQPPITPTAEEMAQEEFNMRLRMFWLNLSIKNFAIAEQWHLSLQSFAQEHPQFRNSLPHRLAY